MRLIIAGSRDFAHRGVTAYAVVETAVAAALRQWGIAERDVTEVVSGCARGVDRLGETWAEVHTVPVEPFPADWKRLGRKAGVLRNVEMARYAAASPDGGGLVAVWNGVSPGTSNMIGNARKMNMLIYVHRVESR